MDERTNNDAATLLLYLSDELPAEARAEIERRLAAEPALAAELAGLRKFDAAMRRVAESGVKSDRPSARDAAITRLGLALRRRQVERIARPSIRLEAEPEGTRHWWMYASGVGAAVMVGFLGWWAWTPLKATPPSKPLAMADRTAGTGGGDASGARYNEEAADRQRQRWFDMIVADPMARVLSLEGESSTLSEAESELGDLAALQNGNDGVDVFLGLADDAPKRDGI